jgi:hypothetical protein
MMPGETVVAVDASNVHIPTKHRAAKATRAVGGEDNHAYEYA